MPAVSKKQQRAMGMAHAIQKGEMSPSEAGPEVRRMAREMKPGDVTDFASTSHKGLPKKACMKLEDIGAEIVRQILGEDADEELEEVRIVRGILNSLNRLHSSLGESVTPEAQRELTSIRAGANNLIRLHLGRRA